MTSSNIIIFNIILLSFFTFVLNNPCKYQVEVGTTLETNSSTLEGLNEDDEKKQLCFSYSNSDVFDKKCCYDNVSKLCAEENSSTNEICPTNSKVFNNCGMAGVYQPITTDTCTEISLVQGYCCFVSFTDGSRACLRTKELKKEKNSVTSQMRDYLSDVKNKLNNSLGDLDFDKVVCKGYNLNNYLIFVILGVISLF